MSAKMKQVFSVLAKIFLWIFRIAVVAGLLVLIWRILDLEYKQQMAEKAAEQRQQVVSSMFEEITVVRGYLLESCMQDNEVREYLYLEDRDCSEFFPELLEEQNAPKSLTEELIVFVDLYFINREEVGDLLEKLNTAEQEEGKMEMVDYAELLADPGVHDYLEHYGLSLRQEEKVIEILESEEVKAHLYWDEGREQYFINLLTEERLLSLYRLSAHVSLAQKELYTEKRQAYLDALGDVSGDSAPRENYILLGANGGNTDTMIFVSIDHARQRITLLSVPRDLWWKEQKINSIYPKYGKEVYVEEIEEVLGQRIDGIIHVEMMAFIDLVDALGGVDFTFDRPLIDPSYKTKDEEGNEGTLYYEAKQYHLRGVEALRVARSRATTSDFSRAARQQKILRSLFYKMKSRPADSLMATANIASRYVMTDIELENLVKLFVRAKDYEIKNGTVMSTKNILHSEMLDLGNDRRAYVLKPLDDDWTLIPRFVWKTLLE